MMQYLLSICIPSYNRPSEVKRLLESIDGKKEKIEIVICEDNSPKRDKIRKAVEDYKKHSDYCVSYIENEYNCGYDKNLRECIKHASGKWIMFMGDDDMFVPGMLNKYMEFLEKNENLGYVLRAYQALHSDGSIEKFLYYPETKFFSAGFEACATVFRKSLFISGFCFRKECLENKETNELDGSLLYQLYISSEICIKYPSAYYGEPITQSIDGGVPFFGNSEAEKDLYTPGSVTVSNSVAFMKKYFVVTEYLDKKHNIELSKWVRNDLSKYSYPILSIQRNKGRMCFWKYHKELCKIGLNCTFYYYIYLYGLLLIGETACDKIIRTIKKIIGRTPQL